MKKSMSPEYTAICNASENTSVSLVFAWKTWCRFLVADRKATQSNQWSIIDRTSRDDLQDGCSGSTISLIAKVTVLQGFSYREPLFSNCTHEDTFEHSEALES